jgi:large subunit ribosomal protein L10
LPSKDILLAQMLSVLNGVPTGLVQVLSAIPRTFLYALQAVKDQKEQEAN